MGNTYTDEKVPTKISAEIREDLQKDGLDPEIRPKHDWLRDNGYSGIEGYARGTDMTVAEILEEKCGFDPRNPKPLGIKHEPTRQSIKRWLKFEEETAYEWGDSRINDARSHIRKISSVAIECLGTSNLLCLIEGDDETSSQKILQLFNALGEDLAQGSQSNYTYTLERWATFLDAINRIEGHCIDDIRDLMGWSYKRRSPEHNLEIDQVRSLWQARESVEEAALLILLATTGERRQEPTNLKINQLRLDDDDPYIVFGEERKTGSGTVPILAGSEVIEEWINELETRDWWDGEWLFPSKKSEDGSRPKDWVNRVIDDLTDRADVEFPDGSDITPKHFRSFWYTKYSEAKQAWLAELDQIADEQGVSSGEVIDNHYLSDQPGRDHFRRFLETSFRPIFGDSVHGIEEVNEKRAEERDTAVQSEIEDYMQSQVADEITDDNDPSYESPTVFDPISPWVRARLLADHAAASASEKLDKYPPSRSQAIKLTMMLLGWITAFGPIWALDKTLFINPLTGSYHITSGAVFGLIIGMLIIFYEARQLLEVPADYNESEWLPQ